MPRRKSAPEPRSRLPSRINKVSLREERAAIQPYSFGLIGFQATGQSPFCALATMTPTSAAINVPTMGTPSTWSGSGRKSKRPRSIARAKMPRRAYARAKGLAYENPSWRMRLRIHPSPQAAATGSRSNGHQATSMAQRCNAWYSAAQMTSRRPATQGPEGQRGER